MKQPLYQESPNSRSHQFFSKSKRVSLFLTFDQYIFVATFCHIHFIGFGIIICTCVVHNCSHLSLDFSIYFNSLKRLSPSCQSSVVAFPSRHLVCMEDNKVVGLPLDHFFYSFIGVYLLRITFSGKPNSAFLMRSLGYRTRQFEGAMS